MKTLRERDIERLLGDDPVGPNPGTPSATEPPADLAQRIKAEIPEDLGWIDTENSADTETPAVAPVVPMARPWKQRRWLVAASLFTVLGGSFFAWRLAQTPELTPQMSVPAAATFESSAERRLESAGEMRATRPDSSIQPATPTQAATAQAATAQDAPEPQPLKALGYVAYLDEALAGSETAGSEAAETKAQSPADPSTSTDFRAWTADTGHITPPAPPPLPTLRERLDASTDSKPAPPRVQARTAASPPPPPPSPAPRRKLAPPPEPLPRSKPLPPGRRAPLAEARAIDPPARRLAASPEPVAQGTQGILDSMASTGGTAEPNDAPFGDVFFESAGVNPFIDTEDDRLSTFGLDVDAASYGVARRYLNDGHLPPPAAIRVEEFVNAFDYGDTPPEDADFALHAEGAPSIYAPGERYHMLRFSIRGRDIDAADRAPALLTFVVDVSGSMAQDNRLGMVKQALGLLTDQLRDDDRVALVIYGSQGRVVLEPTGDLQAIRRAIDGLVSGGSTHAEEGLKLAYALAAEHRKPGMINRIILCSDGVANVGHTSADSIHEQIRHHAARGIELTTVGFGMGNYNDVLMETLARIGNGRYAYVDSLDEAHRIFVEDLTGTLQTLAAEARAQVEFNPEVVSRYRLLGYENRDIADHRFRDDTVDAGEIGAGHAVTVLYEVKLHDKPRKRDVLATLNLRYASIAQGEMVEQQRKVTGADLVRNFDKASKALRASVLVAEFAEILKRTHWAKDGDLDDVFRRAQKLSADFADDAMNRDMAEFVHLVGRAAAVSKR